MIQRGVHPDVRVVRRAPERRLISLKPSAASGTAARLHRQRRSSSRSDAQLRPVMGRSKVYLIVYAEELAEDAGNRLLKTLEEPPPFVVFLLTAIERGGGVADDRLALSGDRLAAGRAGRAGRGAGRARAPEPERAAAAGGAGGRAPGLGAGGRARRRRCSSSSRRMRANWSTRWAARASIGWCARGRCPSAGPASPRPCARRCACG